MYFLESNYRRIWSNFNALILMPDSELYGRSEHKKKFK